MEDKSYSLAFDYALSQLADKLPSFLTYHSYFHTAEEVLPSARLLAQTAGLGAEETRLLEIAAVYHDIGYLYNLNEHENASVKVIEQVLPDFGFSLEEISSIRSMILATRLPSNPKTLAEQILTDADLFILGGKDYFKRNEDLRLELTARGKEYTVEEWYEIQLAFLENHHYFTLAARDLFGECKLKNIQALRRHLAEKKVT